MELLAFATAIVGLAIAGARAFEAFRLELDTDVFGAVMEKILRMGELSRGRKLCDSVAAAPVAAATRAMLDVPSFPLGTSPDDARATLLDVFNRVFEEQTARLVSSRVAAWAALLLLVGPVAYAYASSTLAVRLVAVSALGIVALMWTARSATKTIASGRRVVDRLLPPTLPLVLVSSYRAPEPIVGEDEGLRPNTLVLVIARIGEETRTLTSGEPILKIGRLKNAHVQLDDVTVARMHAVIERADEGVTIIDLGSDRGTIVNGERANKATLAHGDVVEIGPFRLTVGIGRVPRKEG